jgi:uncharacterized coiled-coil protein SlyX
VDATYLLGAAEFITENDKIINQVKSVSATCTNYRALAVIKKTTEDTLLGIVQLADEIRGDAEVFIQFFIDNNVDIKVISGDNLATVQSIATTVGVPDTRAVDLSTEKSPINYSKLVKNYSIFTRVKPAEKKELIKKLQSDYADMEERQSSQKRKIEQNSAILTKQVEVFKKRQEDLDQVNESIDKKLEDLESLNSIGLLNYIKSIPNIIKSDIQDRVKGWKGTVQSFKMDSVTVEAEPCDIVRVDMLNGVNKYYLEVRLSDGLVWYNGATEPYCSKKTGETMYMKELASYFKELTPDAQKMVYDLFTKQSSKPANKVNKLHW